MRLRTIKRILHEIRYYKKLIKKYGDSLLPGHYVLFPNMRAIVADNAFSIESAKAYFKNEMPSGRILKLISKLNESNYYFNKKQATSKRYEALYAANNYDEVREVKLFSFQRKEILTLCVSNEDCKKQILGYKKWQPYFKMPTVSKRDEYNNAYEISMVELKQRPSDLLALNSIIDCFSTYRKINNEDLIKEPVSEIINFCYAEDINFILKKLVSGISPEVLELKIPVCLQHGDLSRDNLLYGKCDGVIDFWWIDWEHAGNRLFIYDYFFYILNTAIYFSDLEGIDRYLNGDCDEALKEYFELFNIRYDPKYRKDYFMVFAIAFLKERVCDLGNIQALEMYYDFINSIVLN